MATELELTKDILTLCKKMFKTFTGVELDYAKQLIELESRFNALSGGGGSVSVPKESKSEKQQADKPKANDNNNIDDLPF